MTQKHLAIIGHAMYHLGYSKERLDTMSAMEVIMLENEYNIWAETHITE